MDAGKVRTFIPGVGLRADSGTDTHAGRRSDAGTVVPKVAPLVALDALLTSADADLKNDVAVALQRPPTGVVVNLSLPALSAEAARQLARAVASTTDYTHLDPHKPLPERSRLDVASEPAEPLKAAAAAVAPPLDRAVTTPAANTPTSPDVRPDLHLHGAALAAQAAHPRIDTPAQKPAVSAVSQARDTERLAGLAAPSAPAAFTVPPHFGKMLLGAAILGALIVILL